MLHITKRLTIGTGINALFKIAFSFFVGQGWTGSDRVGQGLTAQFVFNFSYDRTRKCL